MGHKEFILSQIDNFNDYKKGNKSDREASHSEDEEDEPQK